MISYTNSSMPSAFIGINKNRLKTYTDGYRVSSVYMEDKQEFQIEIFNPTSKTILAKIKLNGDYISDKGLVLKPGERVWLDRYFDDNRKFQFSTYAVENGDWQVDNAIKNNGLVEIEFYDEKIKNYFSNSGSITINNPWFDTDNTVYYKGNNITTGSPYGGCTFTTNTSGTYSYTSDGSLSCDSINLGDVTLNADNMRGLVGSANTKSFKETGRVEKGNYSDQKFNEVDMDFNLWTFHTVKHRIIPQSEQQLNTADVRVKYCTNCGKKINKTNWKFCPDCGEKI